GVVVTRAARAPGGGGRPRGTVIVTEGGRDASLRVSRVALGRGRLGEDQDAPGSGERDRGTETGNAAADDEKVGVVRQDSTFVILAFASWRTCSGSMFRRHRVATSSRSGTASSTGLPGCWMKPARRRAASSCRACRSGASTAR